MVGAIVFLTQLGRIQFSNVISIVFNRLKGLFLAPFLFGHVFYPACGGKGNSGQDFDSRN